MLARIIIFLHLILDGRLDKSTTEKEKLLVKQVSEEGVLGPYVVYWVFLNASY